MAVSAKLMERGAKLGLLPEKDESGQKFAARIRAFEKHAAAVSDAVQSSPKVGGWRRF